MPKYRVLPGKMFGLRRGGEIVEYEAKDAGPYVGTHLELVTEGEAKDAAPYVGTHSEPVTQTEAKAGPPPPEHLAHFADLNVKETLKAAKALTDEQRAELLAWERANKKRATVIEPLVNWNS